MRLNLQNLGLGFRSIIDPMTFEIRVEKKGNKGRFRGNVHIRINLGNSIGDTNC
jgi:hypothetical protein